jgi:hypothetical protein
MDDQSALERLQRHDRDYLDVSDGAAPIMHAPEPWPIMGEAAYYGFAGKVVQTISPHSEADPVALLLQFLVCFGNAVGRYRHFQVESDWHHANLFAALVGSSSSGRKGTALGRIKAIFKIAAEIWEREHIDSGLSSGEGLIHAVRDPTIKIKDGQEEVVDKGVSDKRLLVVEPEFAGVLAVMERGGNTISKLLREAWDRGNISSMTKSPQKATGAHISIIGHITQDELRSRLTLTDMANGFANRFLFALVKRSKELPLGGDLDDRQIEDLGMGLMNVIGDVLDKQGRVTMTEQAKAEWCKLYSTLTVEREGLFGAITARGAPQVIRLALIYALLDRACEIDVVHVKAAVAVWNYCDASARHIFGDTIGDDVADTILRALKASGEGLSRTTLGELFGGHLGKRRLDVALKLLVEKGRAYPRTLPTKGRTTEVWLAA